MIKVGILRGGTSAEYEHSLKSGGALLRALSAKGNAKYSAHDMLVTRDGEWHVDGLPATPEKLKGSIDIVWNALHGGAGEDGRVQSLLEELAIPYIGSGKEESLRTLDKSLAKEVFKEMGIKTPGHQIIRRSDDKLITDMAKEIHSKLSPPWVVKPLRGGSSISTYYAPTYDLLVMALENALANSKVIMVEEYVFGQEFFVGMLDNFRNEDTYALFPLEIMKRTPILDESTYHDNSYKAVIPKLDFAKKKIIEELAKKIHKGFPLRHISSVDLIMTPKGIYAIEADSTPALYEGSRMHRALEEAGVSLYEVVDHLIKQTLK